MAALTWTWVNLGNRRKLFSSGRFLIRLYPVSALCKSVSSWNLLIFLLNYNWRAVLYQFQIYKIVIWYFYTVWNRHGRSSYHLSPYQVMTVLWVIFPVLCIIKWWFLTKFGQTLVVSLWACFLIPASSLTLAGCPVIQFSSDTNSLALVQSPRLKDPVP